MIRDAHLVRAILIEIERRDPLEGEPVAVEGATPERVTYHMDRMDEAGLLAIYSSHGPMCQGLTWSGHELLDLMKNDDHWNRSRELVESSVGGTNFELLKMALLKTAAEAMLNGQ